MSELEVVVAGFQLVGLSSEFFAPLFELSDQQLRSMGARRVVADSDQGFPCRVSLEDARSGEELLLLPYEHQPADSPYRASGPIFVRRGASRTILQPGELSPYVTRRLMSIRAYDADHWMIGAEVCEGQSLAEELERHFADDRVAYIHLHNALPGCFSCLVRCC
jgi:hypothetical protein